MKTTANLRHPAAEIVRLRRYKAFYHTTRDEAPLGFEIIEATSDREAWALAEERKPKLGMSVAFTLFRVPMRKLKK